MSEEKPPPIDIRPDHWAMVRDILRRHVPDCDVWAFGSRAGWTAKPYSDLDLAVSCAAPLTLQKLGALRDAFSQSDLPWKVDVVDLAAVDAAFRKIIEAGKVEVQGGNIDPNQLKMTKNNIGWPKVEVSSLCSHIVDCVNRTAPIVGEPTPYRMVRTTNVRNGRIDLSECRYVSKEIYDQWTRRLNIQDGDIILTREAPIGEVGFVSGLGQIFLGQRIMQYRPDETKVNGRYLFFAFRSPTLQNQFKAHDGSGSVVSHIRVADCHRFLVPLPPRIEQNAIASVLSALDDKIELNRRMNETLEQMAQAIFKDWFVDFGPVRRKQEGARDPIAIMGGLVQDPARAAELAALFPDAFGDDGLPVGWKPLTLESIASLNDESWKTSNHPEIVEYVDLSNAKWGVIEATEIFSWKDAPSRARRVTKPLDTIIGTVRPGNGSYAFISQEGYTVSTGFAVLRPLNSSYADVLYIAATMQENIRRLANLADGHGGAYPAVNPSVVLDTEFPFPGERILVNFGTIAHPLREKIEQAKRENATLAETRDYLLPKLMSGEVRVRDAENIAEAAL